MRASKQLTYSVLKSFRFVGRTFKPGMEFSARRLDPERRQLQRWVDEGFLALPGQKPKPAEVKETKAPVEEKKAPVKPAEKPRKGYSKKSADAPKEG